MADAKTVPTSTSVSAFLDKTAGAARADCDVLIKIMKKATGCEPVMWGPSIVGFGSYHYKYASGHEGDCCITGFSPRKGNISIYVLPGIAHFPELAGKLGKYKSGKSCLYVKKLEDVDLKVLTQLINTAVKEMKKTYKA